jgi:hypothetical protein
MARGGEATVTMPTSRVSDTTAATLRADLDREDADMQPQSDYLTIRQTSDNMAVIIAVK